MGPLGGMRVVLGVTIINALEVSALAGQGVLTSGPLAMAALGVAVQSSFAEGSACCGAGRRGLSAFVREHIEARMRAGGGAAHDRFRGLREDGTVVPVEVHDRVLELDGRMAILGTPRDRGKEARTEAELHLRLTAGEAAPTGIVVTDRDGVIEWANPTRPC